MFQIFIKIFAFLLVLMVVYILGIFFFPEFTDNYGNKEINEKFRDFKNASFQISQPDGSLQLPF